MNLPTAQLISRKKITEDLMVITLRCEQNQFTFKPGQYCTLGIDGIERAYSIASAPFEQTIEIFIELVPDGELTPKIWKLNLGDKVSLRPRAKGIFILKNEYTHHVMVATVTGVSPYISMIRDYLNQPSSSEKVFYVLLGASYQDELCYDQELFHLSRNFPNTVKFIPTISRPDDSRNDGWLGNVGRVNSIVKDQLNINKLSKQSTYVYACGHPGMIEYVREDVVSEGWNFIEERFWKE